MKALIAGLVYTVAVILGGVTLSWLLLPYIDFPNDKILSRSILLVAGLGLIPLWRYLGLSTAKIGFGPIRGQRLGSWYILALFLQIPPMLFFLWVGFRLIDPDLEMQWSFVSHVGLFAVAGALAALLEETLFRGVLLSSLQANLGFVWSAGVSSLAYAAVHFLSMDAALPEENWMAGLYYVGAAFANLHTISADWSSFICLFILGMLFCLVRRYFSLWVCIILHAAWIFGLRLYKEFTVRDMGNAFQSWTGQYDHFTGNLLSVWLLGIIGGYWLFRFYQQRLQ